MPLKYCVLAETECEWVNNPTEETKSNFLKSGADKLFAKLGQDFCGQCGCHLKLKKKMGGACPLNKGIFQDQSS